MLSVLKPELFKNNVTAFFTQKNEHFVQEKAQISGLNLGFNTPDSKETVRANRKQLFDSYGINEDSVVFCNQVHGTAIKEVSESGFVDQTDGLITKTRSLGLCILVADCAAILFYDTETGYIGALHAGWRGTQGRILPKALDMLIQKGSSLKQVHFFISPCISQAEFEVGQEVADLFPSEVVNRIDYEKPHIDLKKMLQLQLNEYGVFDSQIEVNQSCTFQDSEQYYSYRREGKNSGRLMAFIQLQ
jgi:polyphenol oxidase